MRHTQYKILMSCMQLRCLVQENNVVTSSCVPTKYALKWKMQSFSPSLRMSKPNSVFSVHTEFCFYFVLGSHSTELSLEQKTFSVPLTGFEWSWDSADEHRLPWIQRQRRIEDEVCVGESPRSNLHGFVLDGWRGDAKVELVFVLDARVDQTLHGGLVLEGKPVTRQPSNSAQRSRFVDERLQSCTLLA